VRSTRGRNSKGSKITGIEVLNNDENKVGFIMLNNSARFAILTSFNVILRFLSIFYVRVVDINRFLAI
jgi:hypothetical protein